MDDVRYPVELCASLVVGATRLGCTVRELSLRGVAVTGPSLPAGTTVRLVLRVPGLLAIDAPCVARATTATGCSLDFLRTRLVDTHQLARVVSADRLRVALL